MTVARESVVTVYNEGFVTITLLYDDHYEAQWHVDRLLVWNLNTSLCGKWFMDFRKASETSKSNVDDNILPSRIFHVS